MVMVVVMMMIVRMKICIGNNKCHGFVAFMNFMKDNDDNDDDNDGNYDNGSIIIIIIIIIIRTHRGRVRKRHVRPDLGERLPAPVHLDAQRGPGQGVDIRVEGGSDAGAPMPPG